MGRKSYEVTGIVVYIDGGKSYFLYCKQCYDDLINDIRKKHGLTRDVPIFLSSEFDYEPVCEQCKEIIDCEVIDYDPDEVINGRYADNQF